MPACAAPRFPGVLGLLPGSRPPRVIAHRGSSASCPENTAAAFDAALAEGCDGIELDVQLSADGIPFVYHDRSLSRIGAGRRWAGRLTMRELRRLDAGAWKAPRFRGERLLSLEDLLDRYASRTFLLVEIKVHGGEARRRREALAREVARVIRDRGSERSTALLCYDAALLETARAIAPGIRTALNLRPRRGVTPTARRSLERLWALSLDLRSATPAHVRLAHERGRPVLGFTCNTETRLERALRCGVDAIMSDRPAWVREAIAGAERR